MADREMINRCSEAAKRIRHRIIDMTYSTGKTGAHLGGSLSIVELLAGLYSGAIWFHADGTTVHMGVETHNTVGKFQNRVGVQVARYQPGVGIGTHLDGQHVTINTR